MELELPEDKSWEALDLDQFTDFDNLQPQGLSATPPTNDILDQTGEFSNDLYILENENFPFSITSPVEVIPSPTEPVFQITSPTVTENTPFLEITELRGKKRGRSLKKR